MSENSRMFHDFNEYVNRMKDELSAVEAKSFDTDVETDECAKYCEKLSIYERYTDDLIDKSIGYLNVIEQLKNKLAAYDVDAFSIDSNSTVNEGTVQTDLNFIRTCLENRTGLEEKAIDSLIQVQGVVDALMRDYCELVKQNQKLNEQLKSSESSSCDHTDHIEALQHENRMLRKKVDDISTAHQQNTCDSSDFHAEIESLKQKLAKRDKTIEKLMFTSKKQLAPKKCESIESTSNESIEDQNMLMHNNLPLRTRSDGCASYRSCVSTTNLSESEKRDTAKIQALKNGYKELSKIISEKYAQLRKQRMKIAELMKQLEKCARQESTIEQLQQEKEQLENRLKHLPNSIDTKMAIKKQLEKCSTDVEQLKRREQILQQKLSSQDEHIATLKTERKTLLKTIDEMKRTICQCTKELCKYCD